MTDITVNVIVLLIKGIPEGMLAVLALHIFTRTKKDVRKYLLLSAIYITTTYLIRFLPIALGVNTVLSLFVLIISFQIAYKPQLSKIIRTVASSALILILIATSEVLNMLLLAVIYGKEQAESLFTSKDGFVQAISATPTNVFFAIFIFAGYKILQGIDKRKQLNGKDSEKAGA